MTDPQQNARRSAPLEQPTTQITSKTATMPDTHGEGRLLPGESIWTQQDAPAGPEAWDDAPPPADLVPLEAYDAAYQAQSYQEAPPYEAGPYPDDYTPSELPQDEPTTNSLARAAILDGLNDQQRAAAEATDGAVLINAGAGAGKTKTLTARAANILASGLARPRELLITTFTNKAAEEVRSRLSKILGRSLSDMWIGTMHGLGLRMIKQEWRAMGLGNEDIITLDDDDAEDLLEQVLRSIHHVDKLEPGQLKAAESAIEGWKNRAMMPAQARAWAYSEGLDDNETRSHLDAYEEYQQRLKERGAVDFGDMLLLPVDLFRRDEEAAMRWATRFKYIMIDEAQDCNGAQYEWASHLARHHMNICLVGDEDQVVYTWRGAEPENMLQFPTDWAECRVFNIEQNYRSSKAILEAANKIVSNNKRRLGKTLWTKTQGPMPQVHAFMTQMDEADWVARRIAASLARGRSPSEIAILSRGKGNNSILLRPYEEALVHAQVPYAMLGATNFYGRKEIRDCLGFLRLVARADDDIAFRRIASANSKVKFGVGPEALKRIEQRSFDAKEPILHAALHVSEQRGVNKNTAAGIRRVVLAIDKARSTMMTRTPGCIGLAFRELLQDTNYREAWTRDRDYEGRMESLDELARVLDEASSLREYLDNATLLEESAGKVARTTVAIMTIHAAKGLEFEEVYVVNCNDMVMPNSYGLSKAQSNEAADILLEEERRLAYVAVTRAKRHLTLTIPLEFRGGFAPPSRFITEAGLTPVEAPPPASPLPT